jgi:hypothetical protein
MFQPATRGELIARLHASPEERATRSATPRYDRLETTPFGRAEIEAEARRYPEDLAAHRERLRTLQGLDLALYLGEAIDRSGLPSFTAEWESSPQPGTPHEGSGLFCMGLGLAIPNQRVTREWAGGVVYLHMTHELEADAVVVRIRYIDARHGWELRTVGPRSGNDFLNLALHRAADLGRPNYLDELKGTVRAALASRNGRER